ncbi:hypothetical protein [Lysinibacillus fusiformis]|uniref:hypothetical protein n=1 Tax=Lysinibacillus fusiformis TaxID=28031 RepID=UPI00046AD5BA|nr:hypothetical protein [Lysinibacillus fusiformis]
MTVGGIIEEKDIGLSIGTNGTFNNTELTEDGKVRLKIVGVTESGEPHYVTEGEWISEIINIGDNFKEFGKLLTSHTSAGTSSIKAYSRTSNNGRAFDPWIEVLEDGTIQSEKRLFIQVKIVFKAGKIVNTLNIGNITIPTGVDLFSENQYIETQGSLKLKRNHQRDMTLDHTWTGEGSLHRIKVKRDEWVRIDNLNISSKEV